MMNTLCVPLYSSGVKPIALEKLNAPLRLNGIAFAEIAFTVLNNFFRIYIPVHKTHAQIKTNANGNVRHVK